MEPRTTRAEPGLEKNGQGRSDGAKSCKSVIVDGTRIGAVSKGAKAGVTLLCLIAVVALVWPVYRSFLNIKINENEGWNAFYDDAAAQFAPLYPSPDKLITNNYPPLSFYVVGVAGKLTGDTLFAGRFISLGAMFALAFLIAWIVRELGGNRLAGILGGAFFIATMCFFFDPCVGMNEPQLLAHAIMAAGFLLFLNAARRGHGYALPILVMVTAGFFKHNIVTLPFSALVWLAVLRRWKPLVHCLLLSFFLMGSGFAACYMAYGRDFFTNFFTPRVFSLDQQWDALLELQCGAVVIAAWCYSGFALRSERSFQLLNILMITGLAVHFLQRTGEGVDINSQFDLLIAASIAAGCIFSCMEKLPLAQRFSPAMLQSAFVLLLCIRLVACPNFTDFIKALSPRFNREIIWREELVASAIARVKAVHGDVLCDNYICYKAGKPFVVDEFNTDERISTGKLPEDAITARINNHTLTEIKTDPCIEW